MYPHDVPHPETIEVGDYVRSKRRSPSSKGKILRIEDETKKLYNILVGWDDDSSEWCRYGELRMTRSDHFKFKMSFFLEYILNIFKPSGGLK